MNKFTLHFIIPGDCPVKKNAAHSMWFRNDQYGNKVPLKFPLHIWSDKYKDWAKIAVQELYLQKEKIKDKIELPLMGSYFVSYWMFKQSTRALAGTKGKLDLTNLIEAPQDLLAGNAGNFLDKTKVVEGKSQKIKYDHTLYQIFSDDNCKIISSLSTSHIFYDAVNPRTEIFITPFDIHLMNELHIIVFGGVYDNTYNLWGTKT